MNHNIHADKQFSYSLWHSLQDDADIDIIELPGKTNKDPRSSIYSFQPEPFNPDTFRDHPGGNEYIDAYGTPPSAIVRLGGCSLLALTRGDPQTFTNPEVDHFILTAVRESPPRSIYRDTIETFAHSTVAEIGRRHLMAHYDESLTESISRRHMSIGKVGSFWTVADATSSYGTQIAVKRGTVDIKPTPTGGRDELDIPNHVPTAWLDSVHQ